MKRLIVLLSLSFLINSCTDNQQNNRTSNPNCPNKPESNPVFKLENEADFYDNLQSLDIIPTEDIITFQSRHYDFIFCRGNQTWIVQEGSYKPTELPPKDYEAAIAQLGDPPFQSLEWQDKTYQYRVLLDPNPFPDFQVEPKQVVLELIQPDQEDPQRHSLYTLDQVKAKKAGIQLGIPEITISIVHNDRFYWAISPEQGEGNGGIATIVTYDPTADKITVIQPPALAKQQINDLAIAGTSSEPIFWIATQTSGEGNPYLPGMGLVAYRPQSQQLKSYNARNSPLIGVIPHELLLEQDRLWVATGNGICNVLWQDLEASEGWQCWQFELQAEMPTEGLTLYPSLLDETPTTTLTPTQAEEMETVEVLWWSPQDYETQKGRYEIAYQPGFQVTLKENGAISWSDFYHDSHEQQSWEALLYWPGRDWIWRGDRFVRPFDSVPLNLVGGGPTGISRWDMPGEQRPEIYAMRGHLDLIQLTQTLTEVKHYSGWVDDSVLQPTLKMTLVETPSTVEPNPLAAIAKKL